jgi:glucose/arabinose dehydrogenase
VPETTTRAEGPTEPPENDSDSADPPQTGDGRGGVELTEIGSFEMPVYVAQPPGESKDLFVVEQCGRIVLVRDGEPKPQPFLDIGADVSCGGEQGLLSMAFAPDYERSGRFYVDFTDVNGDTRVVGYERATPEGSVADPESARELLFVDQPYSNHNGGQLQFGPDGELYVGLGDGGAAGDPDRSALDPENPLGKILRLDTEEPESYEVFALGLRNPWRFSFDRETGDLWIGDVGQDSLEEIDGVAAKEADGANFGWSAYEGTERFNSDQEAPDAIPPVLTYPLGTGTCAVTGGYVVRDERLESLYGRYVYADFCVGEIRSFTARPGTEATDDVALGVDIPQLSSFGEGSDGRIYATSLAGPVYRLDPQ